ncbi:MAG TPA: hypothetical protein PKV41_03925, partial [Candidatus Omnitrophota bacterium]|nr:hypothetical protein [Candidatus Omnitrophota bacterium]
PSTFFVPSLARYLNEGIIEISTERTKFQETRNKQIPIFNIHIQTVWLLEFDLWFLFGFCILFLVS